MDCDHFVLIAAMSQLNLSARAYYRILKLARTIADLAACGKIQSVHLAEALQYRPKFMMGLREADLWSRLGGIDEPPRAK